MPIGSGGGGGRGRRQQVMAGGGGDIAARLRNDEAIYKILCYALSFPLRNDLLTLAYH